MIKKLCILIILFFICMLVYAQTIDKTQYTEIDLFSYKVQGNQRGNNNTYNFKMVLKYLMQSGTLVIFQDDMEDTLSLQTTRRWTFDRGQVLTIYFSARHSSSGVWLDVNLHDIETSTTSSVKPWLPFVSNGRTDLHGWYLEDLGNGTYRERYFE